MDLNLDKFDLSRVDRFERLPPCSGKPGSLEVWVGGCWSRVEGVGVGWEGLSEVGVRAAL